MARSARDELPDRARRPGPGATPAPAGAANGGVAAQLHDLGTVGTLGTRGRTRAARQVESLLPGVDPVVVATAAAVFDRLLRAEAELAAADQRTGER